MSEVGAILVAAGQGNRAGGQKQFRLLGGKPLFMHALEVLASSGPIDQVVLVTPSTDANSEVEDCIVAAGFGDLVLIVPGGARRQDSVRAGLGGLRPCEWVVVHDAARPFLDAAMIEDGLTAAAIHGAASIATPVRDTLKLVDSQLTVTRTVDREGLWMVQTPQVFRRDLLEAAHDQVSDDVTDDAAMVERLGHAVVLYEGKASNIKITSADDFLVAEAILVARGNSPAIVASSAPVSED